jgi:D-alanyl-D-alanine carboxypeptidase
MGGPIIGLHTGFTIDSGDSFVGSADSGDSIVGLVIGLKRGVTGNSGRTKNSESDSTF